RHSPSLRQRTRDERRRAPYRSTIARQSHARWARQSPSSPAPRPPISPALPARRRRSLHREVLTAVLVLDPESPWNDLPGRLRARGRPVAFVTGPFPGGGQVAVDIGFFPTRSSPGRPPLSSSRSVS